VLKVKARGIRKTKGKSKQSEKWQKRQDKSKLPCRSKGKGKTHGICSLPKLRWLHLLDEDDLRKCFDYCLEDEDVLPRCVLANPQQRR
jgi:hypothetical protein